MSSQIPGGIALALTTRTARWTKTKTWTKAPAVRAQA